MKKSVVVLLHIGYWILYLFLVTMLFVLLNLDKRPVTFHLLLKVLLYHPFGFVAILPAIFGFYIFYFILFERYLLNKKILKLFLSAIGIAIIGSVITEGIVYFTFRGKGVNWGINDVVPIGLIVSFICLANGTTGLIVKGFINWFSDIKLKAELNKRNYEMELALVKSQINPHFLFNTINNIDVLISKDAEKASAYLNKLSDVMRFMLYETKPAKINLSKELAYIEKFIELQKIRTTNEHYINYSIKGDVSNFMIPPMLLIPFIENAFKHAENKKFENAISINIDVENEKFIFECENSYVQSVTPRNKKDGIGNELIKKRLALLYPGKYKLTTTNGDGMYKVALSLY